MWWKRSLLKWHELHGLHGPRVDGCALCYARGGSSRGDGRDSIAAGSQFVQTGCRRRDSERPVPGLSLGRIRLGATSPAPHVLEKLDPENAAKIWRGNS